MRRGRGISSSPRSMRRAILAADNHRFRHVREKRCEMCHEPGEVFEDPDMPIGMRLRCRCPEHKEV